MNSSEHSQRSTSVQIIGPEKDKYLQVSNKNNLFKIAQSLGVPVPPSQFYDNASQCNIDDIPFNYPLVIKPYKSVIYTKPIIKTSVKIISSREALITELNTNPALQFPFTVQDFIPGTGAGVFTFFHQGECKGFFAHRRIREKPPGGGVSVLSASIEPNPLLVDYTTRLLKHVNWNGMAMTEFRIAVDGTPYLMEINARPWGSIQLAIDAGFDFPYMAYSAATGASISPVEGYKIGNRLRWLLGDLDRLYLIWKGDYKLRNKLIESLSFLNFFDPRVKFEVNRLRDFRPFITELKHYLHELRS